MKQSEKAKNIEKNKMAKLNPSPSFATRYQNALREGSGTPRLSIKALLTVLWWGYFKQHRALYFMLHVRSGMLIVKAFEKTQRDSYIFIMKTLVLNKKEWQS